MGSIASRIRGAVEKSVEVEIGGEKVKVTIRKLSPVDFMGYASGILPLPELMKEPKKIQKVVADKLQQKPEELLDLMFFMVQKAIVAPFKLVDDSTTDFKDDELAPRHLGPAYIEIANAVYEFAGFGVDATPFL